MHMNQSIYHTISSTNCSKFAVNSIAMSLKVADDRLHIRPKLQDYRLHIQFKFSSCSDLEIAIKVYPRISQSSPFPVETIEYKIFFIVAVLVHPHLFRRKTVCEMWPVGINIGCRVGNKCGCVRSSGNFGAGFHADRHLHGSLLEPIRLRV